MTFKQVVLRTKVLSAILKENYSKFFCKIKARIVYSTLTRSFSNNKMGILLVKASLNISPFVSATTLSVLTINLKAFSIMAYIDI
jgi:hypothetical protein